MSQNDFTIANQSFPAFRADLNSALQALASNNSGGSAPSTTFANMWWYDTSNNIMYIRNEDNDAWIKFAELDQANDKFVLSGTLQLDDGTVSAPALTFNSDTNMGIYRGGTDILKFVTAGTDAVTIDASQDVTLAGSLNFADNEKAIFGTGSDLQIYHDGSSSYILDNGSGQLDIKTNGTEIRLTKTPYEPLLTAKTDGPVELYYDGGTYPDPKLVTTATGIDVTGTVTTDRLLSIDSTGTNYSIIENRGAGALKDTLVLRNFSNDSGTGAKLIFAPTTSDVSTRHVAIAGVQQGSNSIDMRFYTCIGDTPPERMRIAQNGDISFYEDTGTTPKLFWDASEERLGIGTSSPNRALHVLSSVGEQATFASSGATAGINFQPSGATVDHNRITVNSNEMYFIANNAVRMKIDSSGRVGIGASNNGDYHANNDDLLISTSGSTGITIASGTSDQGRIAFADGTSDNADELRGLIMYNHNVNDMELWTNATRQVTLKSYGSILVGTTDASPAEGTTAGTRIGGTGATQISVDGQASLLVNRVQDGDIVRLLSAGTAEGSISISGTTTSYNGGHISRWSRLLNNSKDTSIVKGTVMTNLNEMIEWSHEDVLWTDEDELPDGVSVGDVKKSAYTEDNEQLNKMAVSSVEGDANVAGVFVNWDDDDDFNDMNIAMTGDMVIRIAQGTTVARGDLLMSAGDGTAKPQGDDIVRSKTIAKVTSTNVSHTYDDGTYLVPCVLMAC